MTPAEYREIAKALRENAPTLFTSIIFLVAACAFGVAKIPLGFSISSVGLGYCFLTIYLLSQILANVADHMAEWAEKEK